jgi:hypothetical protein
LPMRSRIFREIEAPNSALACSSMLPLSAREHCTVRESFLAAARIQADRPRSFRPSVVDSKTSCCLRSNSPNSNRSPSVRYSSI